MKKIIAAMLAVMLIMTAFSGVSWAQETGVPNPSTEVGELPEVSGAAPSELPGDSEAPGDSETPEDSEAPVLNGWQTDASGETFYPAGKHLLIYYTKIALCCTSRLYVRLIAMDVTDTCIYFFTYHLYLFV